MHSSIHGPEANFTLRLLLHCCGCSCPLGLQTEKMTRRMSIFPLNWEGFFFSKKHKSWETFQIYQFITFTQKDRNIKKRSSSHVCFIPKFAKLTFCSVHTRGRRTPPTTHHRSAVQSYQSCHQSAPPHPCCSHCCHYHSAWSKYSFYWQFILLKSKEKKPTGAAFPLPACCSRSCRTCRWVCLSPENVRRSLLHQQWPDYCEPLGQNKHQNDLLQHKIMLQSLMIFFSTSI